MNRFHTRLAASVLMVGSFGFASASARAQAPVGVGRAPGQVFYYTRGYSQVGPQPSQASPAAPAYRPYYSVPAPSRSWTYRAPSSPSTYHEFGTGRNLYLGKPWLPSSR